jgi:hypothetical protein
MRPRRSARPDLPYDASIRVLAGEAGKQGGVLSSLDLGTSPASASGGQALPVTGPGRAGLQLRNETSQPGNWLILEVNGQSRRIIVARGLNDATCCSSRLNRPCRSGHRYGKTFFAPPTGCCNPIFSATPASVGVVDYATFGNNPRLP